MGNVRVKGPEDDGPVAETTSGPYGDRELVQEPAQPASPAARLAQTIRARDSILAFQKAINASGVCRTCGKRLLVQNVAAFSRRPGFVPERISIDTHCTCEGGPAHELVPTHHTVGGAR